MKAFRAQSRVAALVIASLFLLQISQALAGGQLETAGDQDQDRRGVDVTFTKWITISPGYPQMAGFVGDEGAGSFSGEVLVAQTTADGSITRLEAVYEIHDGDRSFTAL